MSDKSNHKRDSISNEEASRTEEEATNSTSFEEKDSSIHLFII